MGSLLLDTTPLFANLNGKKLLLFQLGSTNTSMLTEGGERLIIDVDFRSEFEIARLTGGYKSMLQSLPSIFVGKSDRLLQIISIASEAARQSLKKKGMHIAPWRKAEYVRFNLHKIKLEEEEERR